MRGTLQTSLEGFIGDVINPESDDYDAAARTALGAGAPHLILRPADVNDVCRAVRAAVASERALAIRGGGHSAAGLSSVDDGIVIDLRALNTVEMLEGDRVRVGGGGTWRHVAEVLTPRGLVISSGDTADVGVGGLTLSGGIGWMVRRDGLTLDHLRGVEIVTASGEVLQADAEHDEELFWALRGGGGAYGVVTAFEFEAQRMGDVAVAALRFPAECAEQVASGWAAHMRTASHAIGATLTLANALAAGRRPPTELRLVRSDGRGLEDSIAALRALGTPLSVQTRRMPYPEILHPGAELPSELRASVRSGFVTPQKADAAARTAARLSREHQPATLILHSLGGAFSEVPVESTAFAHRHAELMVTTFAVGPHAATPAIRARLDEVWSELAPVIKGAYANSLDGSAADAIAAVYPPDTRSRLEAVKNRYDPSDLFCRHFGAQPTMTDNVSA